MLIIQIPELYPRVQNQISHGNLRTTAVGIPKYSEKFEEESLIILILMTTQGLPKCDIEQDNTDLGGI